MDINSIINKYSENDIEENYEYFINYNDFTNKIKIPYSNLFNFLNEYCKFAYTDELMECDKNYKENNTIGSCIGENIGNKETLPVMIQMLFKCENIGINTKIYDDDFIKKIIIELQTILIENFKIDDIEKNTVCCFLESESWITGPFTYKYIKFHFPNIQINTSYQKKIIRKNFVSQFRKCKISNLFHIIPIGDIEDYILDSKLHVGLYRSKIETKTLPLKIIDIYKYRSENSVSKIHDTEYNNFFDLNNHLYVKNRIIEKDMFSDFQENIEFWKPIFLSINYYNIVATPKNFKPEYEEEIVYDLDDKNVYSKDPEIMLKYLLALISIDRYKRNDYWLDIGKVIYKITNGTIDGLNMWILESEKGEIKTRKDCESIYYLLENYNLTIKTLGIFARKDNPKKYLVWHEVWCKQAFSQALSLTHTDVGEALWRYFWLDYIYADKTWYCFINNRLKGNTMPIYLNNDIDNRFIQIFKAIRADFANQSVDVKNLMSDKMIESQLLEFTKLIKNLGNSGFRNSVIDLVKNKFYVENFNKIKDSDSTKTGWVNGVVVCDGNDAYFREGMLEDYITMSTGIKFPSNYEWHTKEVVEVMDWFKNVFPDDELLKFFLKDSASQLLGKNAEKFFRIWVGGGNNSKTMIVKLYQQTLGDYCIDFPSTILCKSFNNSSGPDPSTAQAKGVHSAFICEGDDDDDIQGGKLKRMTGGDRFFGRFCGENGGSIENMYKTHYVTNVIPRIIGIDKAVEDRLLILPYLGKWSENAPESKEEQQKLRTFKIDYTFDSKIKNFCQAFAWIMFKTFPVYKMEGLKKPQIVIDYTTKYWNENDCFKMFIDEKLEDDESSSLTSTDLYPTFTIWYKINYPSIKPPASKIFKRDMQEKGRLGKLSTNGHWLGKKIKE